MVVCGRRETVEEACDDKLVMERRLCCCCDGGGGGFFEVVFGKRASCLKESKLLSSGSLSQFIN